LEMPGCYRSAPAGHSEFHRKQRRTKKWPIPDPLTGWAARATINH